MVLLNTAQDLEWFCSNFFIHLENRSLEEQNYSITGTQTSCHKSGTKPYWCLSPPMSRTWVKQARVGGWGVPGEELVRWGAQHLLLENMSSLAWDQTPKLQHWRRPPLLIFRPPSRALQLPALVEIGLPHSSVERQFWLWGRAEKSSQNLRKAAEKARGGGNTNIT